MLAETVTAAAAAAPCRCCQVERYNSLLVGLRRSCAELVKGIKGLVVMSADLDQVRTTTRMCGPLAPAHKRLAHLLHGTGTADLQEVVKLSFQFNNQRCTAHSFNFDSAAE
jgi:hypothetical protein